MGENGGGKRKVIGPLLYDAASIEIFPFFSAELVAKCLVIKELFIHFVVCDFADVCKRIASKWIIPVWKKAKPKQYTKLYKYTNSQWKNSRLNGARSHHGDSHTLRPILRLVPVCGRGQKKPIWNIFPVDGPAALHIQMLCAAATTTSSTTTTTFGDVEREIGKALRFLYLWPPFQLALKEKQNRVKRWWLVGAEFSPSRLNSVCVPIHLVRIEPWFFSKRSTIGSTVSL